MSIRQSHFETCPTYEYFDQYNFFRSNFQRRYVKASYPALCKSFKDNPHYQALGGQQGQQCIKSVVEGIKSYNQLLKAYWGGNLQQKPRIPHYRKKRGLFMVAFTSQNIKLDKVTGLLKLPLSKECKSDYINSEVWIPGAYGFKADQIAEVRIIPQLGKLWAEFVYKVEEKRATNLDYSQAIGIDPGIDNWLTCVTTQGNSFIFDGRQVKSVNARYNKLVAKYKKGKSDFYWDEKLDKITHHRSCFIRDAINKAARFIINYCLNHGIGNIVFGWGQGIKQESNLGKRNNQNFVQIPTARLKERICELAESVGIKFTETEESYTSKTSFIDNDFLPVYGGEKPANWKPSGKRVKRGLYRSSAGLLINADCNGAANILRKVTTQLGLNLVKVGKGALTLPKRYGLDYLSKSYRERGETRLQSVS